MTEETKDKLNLFGSLLLVVAIMVASVFGMIHQLNNPTMYTGMAPMPIVQHHIECPMPDILPAHISELPHSHMCEKSDPFIV